MRNHEEIKHDIRKTDRSALFEVYLIAFFDKIKLKYNIRKE